MLATMPSRPLTPGEVALCETVFGPNKINVNFDIVRIYHESYLPFGAQPNDVAMAPNGNIYFDPAGTLYEADFSTSSIHSKALLIHEMTHVWQHQKGVNVVAKGMVQREYKYLPLTGKPFSDYNIEQQGDIVRDYFYLRNGYSKSGWPPISTYRALIPFVK
jgi:hypothetical protein